MFRKFVVIAAAGLALAGRPMGAADVKVVEQIIAKVNGEIITRGDIDEGRRMLESEARQAGVTGQQLIQAVNERSADLLRDKIDELLLVQRGNELQIKVDPEVTRWVAGIQLRSGISDPDKFGAFIQQNYGVPLEDLKQREKNQILAQRVIGGEVQARIFIPEAEMKKYFDSHGDRFMRQEEVFLSQILISTDRKTAEQTAAAEKKAKELVTRLRQGEKFSDLAVANSDDSETGKNGGYLGSFKRADLRPEIASQVFTQKKGYITDPIKLDNPAGFLILKVEDRHEAGPATFDEVRDEIQGILSEPQMGPKIREFLTKLRQNAFLEVRDGFIDTGAAAGQDTAWHEAMELKPATTTKTEVAARQWKKIFGVIPYARVGADAAKQLEQAAQTKKAEEAKEDQAIAEGTASAEAIPLRKKRLFGLLPMGAPIPARTPSAQPAGQTATPAPDAAPAPAPDKK